jgi:hypothetical protein
MSPRSTSTHSPAFLAFAGKDMPAGFADLVLNVAGQRFDLAVRVATGDDDAVKERGQATGIDDLDITALDVFERVDDEFFQLGQVSWANQYSG